jgi:hypothetical protein
MLIISFSRVRASKQSHVSTGDQWYWSLVLLVLLRQGGVGQIDKSCPGLPRDRNPKVPDVASLAAASK